MLSNFDIEDLAEKYELDLVGVFSKNDLPIGKKQLGSYIINLQDAEDGNGTHWTCFKLFSNGKCCYFDSFGAVAPTDVINFLKDFKPIATNNRHIQHLKSDKCGYFCLSFICYFKDFKGDVFEAYDDYLNCFSNDPKENDKIVLELIDKFK
jgi:hypothetical protein